MSRKKIEQVVEQICLPILNELNYELVDVEYKKEQKNWFLRIYIDKPGGITIDDCQRASERISEQLDRVDPIPHRYYLEVSSPGLDRPLKRDADFERYKGRKVKLKLYSPVGGSKNFTGELLGLDRENQIVVNVNGEILKFDRKNVASARLVVEF